MTQSPSKIKISKVSFKNIQGTSATQEGVILICSSGVPCDTVELNNVDLTFNGAPATAKCANVKPTMTGKTPTCTAPGETPAAGTASAPAGAKAGAKAAAPAAATKAAA